MKKFTPIVAFLFGLYLTNFGQLINENFESFSSGWGSSFSTTPSSSSMYQINETSSSCDDVYDSWEIESGSYWTPCTNCDGNAAIIKYASCSQNYSLVTKVFQPNSSSINIEFDYGFSYIGGYSGEQLNVYLYNETNNSSISLLSLNGIEVSNGAFSQTINVTSGNSYTLRFNYIANDHWGATIDNIFVEEACGPSATFSQNCDIDNSEYSVDVIVNSSNGNYVNITIGATTYYSNVGIGTYPINNLSGTNTITVTNDGNCSISENFNLCDLCSNPQAPADEACDAPLVDLSQPFYGSTSCEYTANSGGPSDLQNSGICVGGGFVGNNDSWLRFTAADDSVILDWEVFNCLPTPPSPNGNGVQLAILDGICSNENSMNALACEWQAFGNGTFVVGSLTAGSEYFIYIDGFGGDECDYTWTPQGGVAITPPNDTCGNATLITCGDLDTSNNILASNVDAPAICNGLTPDVGVWYKYEGNGTDVVISTDNIATNFDTQVFLYSGDCNNLQCINSDDDSGTSTGTSEIEFEAEDGTNYYIYVGGDSSSSTPIGQFGLSITCTSCEADAGNWD